MSGIFNAIGSLFGGGGGGGGYVQQMQQMPQVDLPAVPALPLPVAPPPLKAGVQTDDASAGNVRGRASTLLTRGMGDTSAVPTAKKRLLGA